MKKIKQTHELREYLQLTRDISDYEIYDGGNFYLVINKHKQGSGMNQLYTNEDNEIYSTLFVWNSQEINDQVGTFVEITPGWYTSKGLWQVSEPLWSKILTPYNREQLLQYLLNPNN